MCFYEFLNSQPGESEFVCIINLKNLKLMDKV